MSNLQKKAISWLLTLVMMFSIVCPAGAAEIMPQDTEGETTLAAPVWPAEGHSATYDTLSIVEPAASSNPDAVLVYQKKEGDAAFGDQYWSWLDYNNFKSQLKNLKPNTKYRIAVAYRVGGMNAQAVFSDYDVLELTTAADPGDIKVKVRIIGASDPAVATPDFSGETVNWNGASYINWYKTTEQNVDIYNDETGKYTTYQQILQPAFTELELGDVPTGSGKASIKVPAAVGDYTLKQSGNSKWWLTVLDKNNEVVYSNSAFNTLNDIAHEGDTVVLHYVFDYTKETHNLNGKFAGEFLKTADVELSVYTAAKAVMDKIAAIGTVTRDSKAAIETARAAYDALSSESQALVSNYALLQAAEAKYATFKENATTLAAPQISADNSVKHTNSIKLGFSNAAPAEAAQAEVQVAYSPNGTNWSEWISGDTVSGLNQDTAYKFKARYVAGNQADYIDSAASEAVEIKTTAASVTNVATAADLFAAINAVTNDGEEHIIKLTADIKLDKTVGDFPKVAKGATVTLTADSGKKLYHVLGAQAHGISLQEGSTLNLRDIEIARYNVKGEEGYESSAGAEWSSIAAVDGKNVTVNVDGLVFWGQGCLIFNDEDTQKGYEGVTLNIYSGVLHSLQHGRLGCFNGIGGTGNPVTVNLCPTGNIEIEGTMPGVSELNVIPQLGVDVKSGMVMGTNGSYTAIDDLTAKTLTVGSNTGWRLYTDNTTVAALTAPVVAAADAENAATADVTYTVDTDKITFTVKNVPENAQIFISKGTEVGVAKADGSTDLLAAGKTVTFSGLTTGQEYTFNVQFVALDAAHTDGVTTQKITTKFVKQKLPTPTLSEDAKEITATSIKLTQVTKVTRLPGVAVADVSGVFAIYGCYSDAECVNLVAEKKTNGNPTFTDLTPATTYYFRAYYDCPDTLVKYLSSDKSNIVSFTTKATNLTAPTLSSEGVTVTANSVTLVAPAASTQETGAKIKYRMATTEAGLEDAVWQDSNVFSGLSAETTYYFQAKYAAQTAAWLDSAASTAIFATTSQAAAETPVAAKAAVKAETVYATGKTEVKAGETVTVNLKLEKNPGIISMGVKLAYDSTKLELTGMENKKLLGNDYTASQYITDNPYSMIWNEGDSLANITTTGTLAVAIFKVKEGAATGETTVTVAATRAGDIHNFNLDNVGCDFTNATVMIAADEGGNPPTPTEKTVNVYVTYAGNDGIVKFKDTVAVTYTGENATINDVMTAFHKANNKADGFATNDSGRITKFWGEESPKISYLKNNSWVESLSTTVAANDVISIFNYKNDKWSDLYTWFEKDSYSTTANTDLTLTVKGISVLSSNATANAVAIPEGATVTVYDNTGKQVSGFDTVAVDSNGQLKLKFTAAGTYTVALGGTCTYTANGGYADGSAKTENAPVVPTRCTVTVTAASNGSGSTGGGGGGGGGGSATTKPGNTTTTPSTPSTPSNDNKVTVDMSKFTDVTKNDWYYKALSFAVEKGLMKGVEDSKLGPNEQLNRAMLVTILYRLENEPKVSYTALFSDVADGQWYTNAVIWAAENKIVSGYSDGRFAPNDAITREQLATILHNYAVYKKQNTSASNDLSSFTDATKISAYAKTAMGWANAKGLITGRTASTIAPTDTATRAEVATILQRFIGE